MNRAAFVIACTLLVSPAAAQMGASRGADAFIARDTALHRQERFALDSEADARRDQEWDAQAEQAALRAHPQYRLASRMVELIRRNRCQESYDLAVGGGAQRLAEQSARLCPLQR